MNSYENEVFAEVCDLTRENIRMRERIAELEEALTTLIMHLNDGAYAGESFPDGHPMIQARAALEDKP